MRMCVRRSKHNDRIFVSACLGITRRVSRFALERLSSSDTNRSLKVLAPLDELIGLVVVEIMGQCVSWGSALVPRLVGLGWVAPGPGQGKRTAQLMECRSRPHAHCLRNSRLLAIRGSASTYSRTNRSTFCRTFSYRRAKLITCSGFENTCSA